MAEKNLILAAILDLPTITEEVITSKVTSASGDIEPDKMTPESLLYRVSLRSYAQANTVFCI